jgi:hypothetical protein
MYIYAPNIIYNNEESPPDYREMYGGAANREAHAATQRKIVLLITSGTM